MSRSSRRSRVDIYSVRRVRSEDIGQVKQMVNARTKRFFGNVDAEELLCKSFISLVVRDSENDIVGGLCANNYPNVPSIPSWSWTPWVRKLYGLKQITPRNTLWIHLTVFKKEHTYTFLKPMLEQLFEKCRHLKYVMFVIPPGWICFEWLDEHGAQILPIGYGNVCKVQTLFMVLRQHYVINYKIRRAVIEDNDDIVSLIDDHSKRLKQIYGDYYIAEIVAQQGEFGRHIIVAEHDGVAVAVLGLTEHVNYEILNESFKLETFYGLKDLDTRDRPTDYVADISDIQVRRETQAEELPDEYEVSGMTRETISLHTFVSDSRDLSVVADEQTPEDNLLLFIDLSSYELFKHSMLSPSSGMASSAVGSSETYVGNLESQLSCLLLTHAYKEKEKWARKRKQYNLSLGEEARQDYKPKIPIYYGEGIAFAIEIAASLPQYSDALPLLLEAAFECFPEKIYCVFTLPSSEQSLSLCKVSVRAIPRNVSSFPHELYITHKNAVLSRLSVRDAAYSDYTAIEKLLGKTSRFSVVVMRYLASVTREDSLYRSFTFRCGGDVIGFAIISEEQNEDYIESHYKINAWTNIARHRPCNQGCLNAFILSPIFQKHVRFLLLELHRCSDYAMLYVRVTTQDVKSHSPRILPAALCEMLPVLPSKIPEFGYLEHEDGWRLPEVLGRCDKPYALYISTPAHCSLPRYEVNSKIVVVGASDVALSFLAKLLFKNNPNYRITFNNVTLVSPHGIARYAQNDIRNTLLPDSCDMDAYYLALISLRTYVNVINGVMSAINRKAKLITVNNTTVQYDLLFLMCGKQYQMLQRSTALRGKRVEYPSNVMIINTEVDADAAINKLHKLIIKNGTPKYNIIVYGYSLEAYCCVSALLALGIPGGNITFVEPLYDELTHDTIFNDSDVADLAQKSLHDEGILTYYGYAFADWNIDLEEQTITSASFESKHKVIRLDCIAMFAYGPKCVSSRTFIAIHRAGLVFDGALVIGPDCSTNDPNIYAAGTLTKYPRRYYADHMNHQNFNRLEIGHKLAEQIAAKLVPQVHEPEEPSFVEHCNDVKNKMLVPQYEVPITTYCVLPGGIRYLYTRKPGLPIPLQIAVTKDSYGQVLTSGSIEGLEHQGYFRLHLNNYNTVETITCLAKFDIEKVNIKNLWGKHERLLNNLVQRFEMVMIPDLFEYFKEPWICALHHDQYPDFANEATKILLSLSDKENQSVIEDIIHTLRTIPYRRIKGTEQHRLVKDFTESEYCRAIEEAFMRFLGDNILCLPMYAHAFVTKVLLAGYADSPNFKRV